jgi:hypothetical protein
MNFRRRMQCLRWIQAINSQCSPLRRQANTASQQGWPAEDRFGVIKRHGDCLSAGQKFLRKLTESLQRRKASPLCQCAT